MTRLQVEDSKMRYSAYIFAVLASVSAFGFTGQVCAQEASSAAPVFGTTGAVANLSQDELPPEVKILQNIEKDIKAKYRRQAYIRSQVPSLFFTPEQHALLREARIGFDTHVPTLQASTSTGDPNDPNFRSFAVRNIYLAGIVYNDAKDWTIYLNKARVTPANMPSEIVDIKVYKDYIELKWFDQVTNQVFPIRLRPNQRFNLDAKVFLPGASAS